MQIAGVRIDIINPMRPKIRLISRAGGVYNITKLSERAFLGGRYAD